MSSIPFEYMELSEQCDAIVESALKDLVQKILFYENLYKIDRYEIIKRLKNKLSYSKNIEKLFDLYS